MKCFGRHYVTSIATVLSAIPFNNLSGSLLSLAKLLMALLGVTFGTLSRLVAAVASFKAEGEGAEVLAVRCTLTGVTTFILFRRTAVPIQELFTGNDWGLLVRNAGNT